MTLAQALLGFALVAGLLTIIPGLDTALVLRAALTQSKLHAWASALGIGDWRTRLGGCGLGRRIRASGRLGGRVHDP